MKNVAATVPHGEWLVENQAMTIKHWVDDGATPFAAETFSDPPPQPHEQRPGGGDQQVQIAAAFLGGGLHFDG